MNFKMLKKDLKRKKSMNLILLIFVMLATVFITSSLSNLSVALKGTDDFFDLSGVGDYVILSIRENLASEDKNDQEIEQFLEEEKDLASYMKDPCLYLAQINFKLGEEKIKSLDATSIFNCYKINQQCFFDQQNKQIIEMENGTIYVPNKFMEENKLTSGDKLTITTENGFEKSFRIIGSFKDAFLGADMMSTHRYIISEEDFDEMYRESGLPCGSIYSINTDHLKEFKKDYNNQNLNVLFNGDRNRIKLAYVMDMVIAVILMILSVCLIAIAAIMLRFIIVFTVTEDYKEIGIMKAIGMKNLVIRKLYLTKYLLIASVGAFLGFLAGIPFGQILLKQVVKNIVAGNANSRFILQFIESCGVAALITLFAFLSTGKIKKFSPMDAIRSGNNGERFKKKGIFHLHKSHFRATTFIAVNDVLSELKKYLVLLCTSIVGMWLVIMPINTINTLSSERMGTWLDLQKCDLFLSDDVAITNLIVGKNMQAYHDYVKEITQTLTEHEINVEKVFMEVMYQYKIRKGDTSYNSAAVQGINTLTEGYAYEEGTAPKYENEVALSHVTAGEIGAEIGDTVYITIGDEEKTFLVSAIYQTMSNRGEDIRFHQDVILDASTVVGGYGVQINLAEKQSKDEFNQTIKRVKELYPNASVKTQLEFINSMLGSTIERIDTLKPLILGLVILINILVVVLMQRMFLIREEAKIGMMKAIGFSKRSIIGWQTKRIMLILFVGILIGTITGTPFSKLTSGQVFKIMGASRIEFVIRPMEVYVLYPIIVFISIVCACVITMQRVRKISVQEMNQME